MNKELLLREVLKFTHRWDEHWVIKFQGMKRKNNPAPAIFNNLINLYTEPSREYHNIEHINECLEESDNLRKLYLIKHSLVMKMALMHHDAIYDPTKNDNEERSNELMRANMKELGFVPWGMDLASDLVLVTKPLAVPKTSDEFYMRDIDYSILGKPWERYDRYMKGIRKEYSHVSDEDFKKRRMAFLEGCLKKSASNGLYFTDYFKKRYEAYARDNLQRELAILEG